jgi:hypothetical protein
MHVSDVFRSEKNRTLRLRGQLLYRGFRRQLRHVEKDALVLFLRSMTAGAEHEYQHGRQDASAR